jgi:hypothetical protein
MGEVHFRSMPTDGAVGLRTFMTDRPTVEEPLRDIVGQAIDSGDYPGLPEFVRAWNEQRGWATFASEGGAAPTAELLATAKAVLTAADPRTVDVEVWEALQRFVRHALEHGSENIWAVDE